LIPYWLLFSVFTVGALQARTRLGSGGSSTPLFIVASLFLTLMIGLRYEVGGDWFNYVRIFERLSYLSFEDVLAGEDPGYGVLNWAAARIGLDIWAVNLVCAGIFTFGLSRFARVQSNPWFAMLIAVPYLIIVVAMGYTRQAVAIGFILAGLAGLNQNRLGRFFFYVVLAATFHRSAMIVLPLIGLAASRNRFITLSFTLISGLMIYYLFVASSLERLFVNYVEESMESQGALIRVALNIPAAVAFYVLKPRFGFSPLEQNVWRNFSVAAFLMLAILFLTSATTAVDRIALYLIPLQIAVLCRLPSALSKDGLPSAGFTLLVIAYLSTVQYVWLQYAIHADYWLPYQLVPVLSEGEGI
jgi:hypothetical protein